MAMALNVGSLQVDGGRGLASTEKTGKKKNRAQLKKPMKRKKKKHKK